MESEHILLYRVDNLEEERGIWRTWDGQWKPVFDDIIPNGLSKNLPMGNSETYKGGWFASCENLPTLFKWVSKKDLFTLQKHGFRVTTWDVDIKDTKRLNDMETIFLKQKATLVGWYDFDEEYLKVSQSKQIKSMNKNMDFGGAIAALKEGKKVSRLGWNGKGMFLWLKEGTVIQSSWCKDPLLKGICEANGGTVEGLPTICMKTADNKVLTGWLASQTDMLSEDWTIVE